MDFSPMHPDVWAATYADRWNEYHQYLSAYEEGRDTWKDEAQRRKGNPDNVKKGMADLIGRIHPK